MQRNILRNPVVAVVSLVVMLVAMLGTALAESPTPQRRRVPNPPPAPTRHDTTFKSVPGSKLQIRAVEYNGSTNGTLTVQVKNTEKSAQKFTATGLYFVPEGDPDEAPQRLGAVGPMQIATGAKEVSELEVAAGATVEVQLDVFCIDSHRPSPSPQNRFNVGATKMPKELAATIETRANAAVTQAKESGQAAPRPAAKSAIQSEVWRSRDSKWVELDGEGKQETAKKKR